MALDMESNPIIVGGVGGSGTRVFAESLLAAGLRTLSDINQASDAQGCALLFKRPGVLKDLEDGEPFEQLWSILEAAIHGDRRLNKEDRRLLKELSRKGRPYQYKSWLRTRAKKLKKAAAGRAQTGQWFLKEPNLHMVAPKALEIRPELRFVMAVRHGVDMAFSRNQQQLAVWGATILDEPDLEKNEVASLRYWCAVHKRIAAFKEQEPDRVLILSFDQLCSAPEVVLPQLFEFSGVEPTAALIEQASAGVKMPSSIGRRHNEDLSSLDPADMEFVESYMATIEHP